jgi:hypothetical protein
MEIRISIPPKSVLLRLIIFAVVLIVISVILQLAIYLFGYEDGFRLVRLFHVDEEKNIPAVFSVGLLLGAALLLAIIGAAEWEQANSMRVYWLVLSAGFTLMAIDEGLSFHESLDMPMRSVLAYVGIEDFYYAWIVPAALLTILLFLFFLRFLAYLPRATRTAFLVAGAFYLSGALLLEFLAGRYAKINGEYNLTYSMMATVEESLEIIGSLLFIWALLTYLMNRYKQVTLNLHF